LLLGIQVLRLLAASSIVLYHVIHYAVEMGVVPKTLIDHSPVVLSSGVTVFFVISGFLMAALIERSTPFTFIAHRLLRIYPPFLAAVGLVTLAKILLFGSAPPFSVVRVLTLVPSGSILYPLGVEWSLVYEVFFYFIAMALCFLPNASQRKLVLLAWAALIIAANEGGSRSVTQILPSLSNILFSYLNTAFIVGMFVWWTREKNELPAIPTFIAGLVAITIAYTILSDWIVVRYLVTVAGSAFLVKAAAAAQSSRYFSGRLSVLPALGDGSYGLYLLHVPIITIFYALSASKSLGTLAAATVFAFVLGTIYGIAEYKLYMKIRRFADFRRSSRTPPTAVRTAEE
jgi:peptidoglycan/LPS O-acetylase OafA/YrhL